MHASLTEPLPIVSDSIDCILSNCVVNLLPLTGKSNLFKEAYRVLKPGGRIVLDDVSLSTSMQFEAHIYTQIVAKKALPDNIRNDLASYVGCIAGAIEVDIYKGLLMEAGLTGI